MDETLNPKLITNHPPYNPQCHRSPTERLTPDTLGTSATLREFPSQASCCEFDLGGYLPWALGWDGLDCVLVSDYYLRNTGHVES